MNIRWLELGNREYDLEYLSLLEAFLKANNTNDRWAKILKREQDYSRELTADERISINREIARIKEKWHITVAA